jgi:hypothetical protein
VAAILAGAAFWSPASAGCSSTERVLYFEQVGTWDQAYVEVYGHPSQTPHRDHDLGHLSYRLHASHEPDGANNELWNDLSDSLFHGCGARIVFTVNIRLSASGAAEVGYAYVFAVSSDQGAIGNANIGYVHTGGVSTSYPEFEFGLNSEDLWDIGHFRVDARPVIVWGDAKGSGAIDYGTAQVYIRSEGMLGAPRLIWRDYVDDPAPG